MASSVIYHNIGGILHSKGDFTSAEPPGRKAWEISRRLLGEDDPRTLFDAVAYAAILDGLQRYDESEAIYRRALAIFEKTFGPEHYEVAANLHNLAAVLGARGDLDQAEQLYRRALAIKEKLLGADSPDAALTRNNLGALLNLAGRPEEAAGLLQRAVDRSSRPGCTRPSAPSSCPREPGKRTSLLEGWTQNIRNVRCLKVGECKAWNISRRVYLKWMLFRYCGNPHCNPR